MERTEKNLGEMITEKKKRNIREEKIKKEKREMKN